MARHISIKRLSSFLPFAPSIPEYQYFLFTRIGKEAYLYLMLFDATINSHHLSEQEKKNV